MGDVHIFQDSADLSALGLDGKELSTFVSLLSRLISTSSEAKEGPRKIPEQSLTAVAENLYRFRRRRDTLMTAQFGTDIFADPAWDIILDLFIHHSKNQDVCVTSACAAAMVPITTALPIVAILPIALPIVHEDGSPRTSYGPCARQRPSTSSLQNTWPA